MKAGRQLPLLRASPVDEVQKGQLPSLLKLLEFGSSSARIAVSTLLECCPIQASIMNLCKA